MSKKSRKKSSKTSSLGPTRSRSSAAAKTRSAKGRRAAARKSIGKTTSRPSHKAPSKRLKSAAPRAGKRAAAMHPESLVEGAAAPAFHLPRDGGSSVSLADFRGRKLVLFFYPRVDTPGCTREAMDFTRLSEAFARAGTAVLGISADPPKAQEAFRDKHELATPLASDEQHEMLEAYGVWGEKSMYGRTFLGVLRTTVLIGEDGRVLKIWRNVKVDGHADEVLAAVRAV